MKTIGIFYGSSTGTTKEVAESIAKHLGVEGRDIHDVAESRPSQLGDYDVLILGSSTYGSGELQDDWYDFIAGAEQLDLKGKTIAIFGCGDETMTDTFCEAVGIIYDRMRKTEANFIGEFPATCYDYGHTSAEVDGIIRGLLIDNVNHPDLTPGRVEEWCQVVEREIK